MHGGTITSGEGVGAEAESYKTSRHCIGSEIADEPPVVLVPDAADVLQIVTHLHRALGHLGEIGVLESGFADRLFQLRVEQGVAPSALKLGENSGPVDRHPLRPLELNEQVEDIPGEKAALAALEGIRHAAKTKHDPNPTLAR